MRFRGQVPRPDEPEEAHVRELPMTFVRSLRLSERRLLPGHVENVVDDLEEHAQLRSEPAEGDCGRSGQSIQKGYALDRGRDQAACFELVEAADVVVLARDVHV